MYIKLGNTNINYINKVSETGYMIISDLVNSDLSFETPVLVNSEEELDIWFSKSFKDREYLASLLGSGVSLYLYKPLSIVNHIKNGDINLEDYIDVTFSKSIFSIDALENFKNLEYKILVNSEKKLDEFKLSTAFTSVKNKIQIEETPESFAFNIGEEKRLGSKLIIDYQHYEGITVSYNGDFVSKALLIENKTDSSVFIELFGDKILLKSKYGIYIHNKKWIIYQFSERPVIVESEYYQFDENLQKLVKSPSNSELPILELVLDESDLQKLETLKISDNIKVKFENQYYIWDDLEFISESEFPQNLEGRSESLSNRETLLLPTNDFSEFTGVSYCYPEYREFEDKKLGIFTSNFEDIDIDINSNTNVDRVINQGLESYILNINFSESTEKFNGYITVSIKDKLYYFYSGNFDKNILKNVKNKVLVGSLNEALTPKEFINLFIESFYEKCSERIAIIDNSIYGSYSLVGIECPFNVSYFYEFPEINIVPDFSESNKLITKSILKDDNNLSIEFYSKVIGTWDISNTDASTRVTISNIDNTYYRATITKYEYSEIFEAPITPIPGEDTLDNLINKNSKLVYCKLLNITSGIPEGTFVLKNINNISETITNKSWMSSLEKMLGNNSRNIYSDYFLISDMNNYVNGLDDNYYYKEYLTFLDYAKSQELQFLIQNSKSKYSFEEVTILPDSLVDNTIYYLNLGDGVHRYYKYENNKVSIPDLWEVFLAARGNDYVFNYTGDTENRLVYFYNPIYIGNIEYPGYSLYLNSVLNNTFSERTSIINYSAPGGMTTYEDTELETSLKKYKSNYLTFNNLKYFYSQIFNGEKYITTGYLRFILGKISRELGKASGKIISLKNLNDAYRVIYKILSTISEMFSEIVVSIAITDFVPVIETNSLNVEIETKVSEFVDNNITINIILNYNK